MTCSTHISVGNEFNEVLELLDCSHRHRLNVLLSLLGTSMESRLKLFGRLFADQHDAALVQALEGSL